MKQERASRTRRALLTAAAEEFDRLGYAGASLGGIARAAGISLGALTFHFPSKQELSTAVREEGCAATRALVARTRARRDPPVQCVVSLTLGLVELLQKNPSVRAAARLDREAADARHSWRGVWTPLIHERLRGTPDAGASAEVSADTVPGASPGAFPVTDSAALTVLAVLLVCGTEATLPRRDSPDPDSEQDNSALLARVWRQILPQAAPPGCGDGRPPRPHTPHPPLQPASHTALQPPSTGTPAPVTNEA
ncbi:TetR family transcriptional regulator [Streptomyces sp. NPDC007901]|uniref:TetR family transcriptional regulator n=1 Tax=Streptomyces sp. NPDC007901 TaxID=3364785 RepID=UPI0036ED42B8